MSHVSPRPAVTLLMLTLDSDTFDIPNPTNSSSYPPPGPPLLDNNESGILENFFENPNNVDPTFLSVGGNYQDGTNLYNSSGSLDWMNNGMTSLSHASTPLAPTGRPLSQPNPQRPRSNNFPPRMEHHSSVPATEDVYAAARLLHNNTAGRFNDMSAQFGGYGGGMSTGGPDMSHSNGYGYPPIPSPTTAQYDFNAASAANGLYNMADMQSHYNSGDNTGDHMQGLPGRVRRMDARGAPMRFGSDDNFRNNYTGPVIDEREKEVAEGFVELYRSARNHANPAVPRSAPTAAAPQKRPRNTSEVEAVTAESEDYQSSDEDDYRVKKRRKSSKLKDEDEVDFEDTAGGGKNGKRRQSVGQSKSRSHKRSASSPAAKQKSSPSMSKPQRENLTEEQKRSNHIQSEQKRRNLIKQGFEDINKMVPELRAGGFSKSNMLVEAAKFMKFLKEGNDELKAHMRSFDNG